MIYESEDLDVVFLSRFLSKLSWTQSSSLTMSFSSLKDWIDMDRKIETTEIGIEAMKHAAEKKTGNGWWFNV